MIGSAASWARESFGGANFGDARRSRRFVRMMARSAAQPAGRITQVFVDGAERQAAYDFVENDAIASSAVISAIGLGCARRAVHEEVVLVAVDGTSLNLSDGQGLKGFGSVGTRQKDARGLKVMNTLALRQDGTPLGVPTQRYWARGTRVKKHGFRSSRARESVHWRCAVDDVSALFVREAPNTRLHFIADREADASLLMKHLVASGHDFTIRANGTRKIMLGRRRVSVRPALQRMKPMASVGLHVPARAGGKAREARLALRVARVSLVLRDRHLHKRSLQELHVVWAREQGRLDHGQERIEWMLYTTCAVTNLGEAYSTLQRYSFRWRIEEMHRTWKSGTCNAEDMQLRSREAAIKWACMLGAVAARVEMLKQLSRSQPDDPASIELSTDEIQVLILLKHQYRKRNEVVSDGMPSIAQAVRWIADLGGYVANKGNGPPGSVVITRGMERLTWSIAALQAAANMR